MTLGIDIGGSGIKGAPVDLDRGEFALPRLRVPTPQPSTPSACARAMGEIVEHFAGRDDGPIGITIPAPVIDGVTPSMANLDQTWAGFAAEDFLTGQLRRPVTLLNDADAAGIAEMRFGAGRDRGGLVIMTTLGTGIGTALFHNGVLIPNSELGHMEVDGHDAETRASSGYREREGLSWKKWARHLQRYYAALERLLCPDLFIVGGGVSKKHERFLPLLDLRTPIVPARLRNEAGIIGAALAARHRADGA
ncbi:polyphosphate--glucose phosphotransferase [uncultured Propionibacterium sp.]|uniref:polyphosphate--glucose phosphotransferase n=1 Tax=uncultured Propionibacterium sp. TaxID=218066 RepID=UPI00292DABEC|nr:ROK family protein [uncultured Propionibacterium sp.]